MASQKDLAIQAALQNNWQDACAINEKLLQENPEDIDTINRYAFSLLKLGRLEEAIKAYKTVIELDKTNPIALKNLRKLETMSKNVDGSRPVSSQGIQLEDLFIEEAGKTKTVVLTNLADRKTLSYVQPGDILVIAPKRSKIFLQNSEKKYIGMLPDSVGMRLTSLIKGGNEYQACIKAIDDKSVKVFIRETKRASRFKNQPSFTNA